MINQNEREVVELIDVLRGRVEASEPIVITGAVPAELAAADAGLYARLANETGKSVRVVQVVDIGQSSKTIAKMLGGTLIRFPPDWFECALNETSATPKGQFKQAWTMKLMRSGNRCQLPRGFVKGRKPVFVG